jgi:hypothetical protein
MLLRTRLYFTSGGVMATKIALNIGFLKIETDVNFTDRQRENWAKFVSTLEDYQALYLTLDAEYAGRVFDSIVRLRNVTLPEAVKDLKADDALSSTLAIRQRGRAHK